LGEEPYTYLLPEVVDVELFSVHLIGCPRLAELGFFSLRDAILQGESLTKLPCSLFFISREYKSYWFLQLISELAINLVLLLVGVGHTCDNG
jgi:hypothetical protein